jgi:hypothetical protein
MEKWIVRIVLLALSLACFLLADEPAAPAPKLLLSAKLLRRLKRDRERQTVRWVHFEERVKNVPDSPERGFELALYYAVTADEARSKEAVSWASSHPCERRQRALIQDWVAPLPPLPCSAQPSLRDQAFERIAAGLDTAAISDRVRTELIPRFAANGITGSEDLYALIELISVLRASTDKDIRNANPLFFRNLPLEFLLSLRPEQVEHPTWMTHVAALALVTVDPNLEASQFLQGWAMEDRQTLRDGPGVAYELLWADPYLPGIAYQNLDPWTYDEEGGRLFARSDWTTGACWIAISKSGVSEQNCPPGWRDKQVQFGSLTLVPAPVKCLEVVHQEARQNLVIWKFAPGEAIGYSDKQGEKKSEKKEVLAKADQSGLWHPGANVTGRVCRR